MTTLIVTHCRNMTYARARLWLGIGGVGKTVAIATAMLVGQVPRGVLPDTEVWRTADMGVLVAFVLGFVLLMLGPSLQVNDVSSEYAQLSKNINLARIHRYDAQRAAWKEIVIEDKRCGPAEIAIMRIDFAALLKALSPRVRRIAKTLASGETTGQRPKDTALVPAGSASCEHSLSVHGASSRASR